MAALAIFMFICVVTSEVAANPLLQALTSQNCPICQPNSLRHQLASLLFQPTNNQPCQQRFMAQNPAPHMPPQNYQCSQCKNDQCHPVLNKILSNPTLKSILDPNTKLINQNGVEVPRNGPNGVPNVINNYFIVPPELLMDDAKCKKEDRKVTEDRRGRKPQKNNRRKSIEVTTDKNVDMKRSNEIEDVKAREEVRDRKPKRRRNKNKVSEVKVKVKNETVYDLNQIEIPIEVNKDEESATESNDYKVLEVTTPYTVDTTTDKHINIVQNENNNSEIHKKLTQIEPTESIKIKLNDSKNLNDKPRRRTKSRIKTIQPNTKENEAINEFCRKYPNIPEKLVRDLLTHMRRQIEKEQLGINLNLGTDKEKRLELNETTEKIPEKRNKRRRKNRRVRKRKPQSKTNCDPTTTTIELTPTIVQETTTEKLHKVEDKIVKPTEPTIVEETTTETNNIETTTPKYYKNNDMNKLFNDYDEESIEIVTKDDKFENKEAESIEIVTANQQEVKNPDLGSEDVVPTIYLNGLVDDYYPDFTGDNQYYSSEDLSLINFDEDRYHYTTDRNYELGELNRERRKLDNDFQKDVNARIADKIIFRLNQDTVKRRNQRPDNKRFKNVESNIEKARIRQRIKLENGDRRPFRRQEKIQSVSIEHTEPTTVKTAEIQFRTPPTLENIDFETRPVNKNFYFHDNIEETDADIPEYEVDNKKTDMKPKNKHLDEIETVYARSKVVTYGRMSEEATVEDDSSGIRDNFDDTSVVLAKTVKDGFWRR